ncbi:hypothetical protein E2C01_059920 [Portunus trituberculatus]|uniref:Uncharacterized protein n=1 Tax=Portunus trituberculatus TaxID=210409 RepID=A0A5B7HAL7_PORTR|nr:hypothetical protein [Portunus trituberculatus]
MVTVLSQDAFIDTLEDQQVQIYVKQAHPADVQQVLARAMEFEAFMYTIAAAVTPYHRSATQKLPRHHLLARPEDTLAGGCASTFSHQGLLRELWTVGSSPCYLLTAEGRHDGGGKRKQAGSSGHCPAKLSPGPVCVKCHSDATVLVVQVSGAVNSRPCPLVVDTGAARTFVRPAAVWHDWPLYDTMRPHDVYDHGCGCRFNSILEDAVEQVESPVMSSDVEDERLELHCRVVREDETADTTVMPVNAGQRAAAEVRWTEMQVRRSLCYLHTWWTWRYVALPS